ncbi:phosphotransferase [uncultured Schumannella sp.]|uniref:phosphotransferase n=1 Tax=uncultured Schumannella sp. TaxID=1195956 RepID=UPI0025E43FD6|nr:phosphotransferase [uncultured Schumannella sp.]
MSTAPDADALIAVFDHLGSTVSKVELLSLDTGTRGDLRGYRVLAQSSDGTGSTHFVYVEPADPAAAAPPGVVRVADDGGETLDVWEFPHDASLPTLAAAGHPDGARVLLARMGLDPGPRTEVRTLSYRPHRRAAVRVRSGEVTVYLKVVPPGAAEAIAARHDRWLGHGIRVPASLGWSAEGLIALAPLVGAPVADLLPRLTDLDHLVSLLDDLRSRIASAPEQAPARRSLASRSGWYRDRLSSRHAALAGRLARLSASIATTIADTPPQLTTIHGDLHLGQVVMDPDGAALGVLDLDTGGVGDPADDDGGIWAHLVSTAYRGASSDDAPRRDAALALLPMLHPRRVGGPRAQRAVAVAATHLLGHALSGAIPISDAVDIAEHLLDAPDEMPLIPLSSSSHLEA